MSPAAGSATAGTCSLLACQLHNCGPLPSNDSLPTSFPLSLLSSYYMVPSRDQIASSGQKARTNAPHGWWKVVQHSGACMRLCTYFVIQVVIALIHLVLSKIPLVLYMDMRVELPRLSLGKLEEQSGSSITGNAQILHHCSIALSQTPALIRK